MAFIAVLMLLAAVLPHKITALTSGILSLLVKGDIYMGLNRIILLASDLSRALLIFYGILITIILLRLIMFRNEKVEYFKTWDCGYQGGTPRMQYTASSFSSDTVYVTKPILIHRKELIKPEGIFPKKSSLKTENIDITDIIINYFIKSYIEKFFNAVSVIQSRTAQQYVIYVIVFIIVTFIWIIGVK